MLDMSGKSKKNKAPKAEVPKDDNVPVEEFDEEFEEETAAVETVPERKGKDTAEPKKKKSKARFRARSRVRLNPSLRLYMSSSRHLSPR